MIYIDLKYFTSNNIKRNKLLECSKNIDKDLILDIILNKWYWKYLIDYLKFL